MASTTTESVTVLKRSLVSPPPSLAAEVSLPLTHLDMIWLHFLPIERLMFYEIPRLSRPHFIHHIVPKLELSLSFTLGNFLPLAGNLIIPPDSSSALPEIRYVKGNSVTVTFSECNDVDRFGYLTADEARNCRDFRPLIPELFQSLALDADWSPSTGRSLPVLGIQVTLFPNSGISIGISNHHAVGDASTIFHYMKTWTKLQSQLQESDTDADSSSKLLVSETLPFYDRAIIEDPKGLAKIFFQRWNRIIEFVRSSGSFTVDTFLNKIKVNVRKTFLVSRKDVDKLKNLVMKNGEKVLHLSSFTVTCAYVWTCLVKSRAPCGEEVSEEELEHFSFYADCRGRMDPPVPKYYFGNCLTHCVTTSEYGKLLGEEGFQLAAELIGKTIHERLKNSESLFQGAEKWMDGSSGGKWERDVGVAGSPKYNYYDMDFGWGKPTKFEFVSIDLTGAISLNGCSDPDGGIEVGLSLPKPKMDAFCVIFREGLNVS